MNSRADEIAVLKKLLDDGEGDQEINAQAIKIWKMIREARNVWQFFGNVRVSDIDAEVEEFERVIREIRRRRHDHVLDTYDHFVRSETKS